MKAQDFAVPSPDARLVALVPGLALLGIVVGVVPAALREPRAWLALPVALALFAAFVAVLRRRRVSIDGGVLTVIAGLNTRRLATQDLDLAGARIVDLREHTAWAPSIRLFGTGMPGLRLGHYWLRDRSRAFVLLTDASRVLMLPERSGRRLLLSLVRPQALLEALQLADARTPEPRAAARKEPS